METLIFITLLIMYLYDAKSYCKCDVESNWKVSISLKLNHIFGPIRKRFGPVLHADGHKTVRQEWGVSQHVSKYFDLDLVPFSCQFKNKNWKRVLVRVVKPSQVVSLDLFDIYEKRIGHTYVFIIHKSKQNAALKEYDNKIKPSRTTEQGKQGVKL